MEQESENLKMGEHLAILSRAVKMLFSLSRGYILCTILKSFLGAAVLYVPIYFSARLLDAILYGAPAGVAFRYAGLTIGLAFLCNLLLTWINAARNVWEEKLYRERDWMFSEKEWEWNIPAQKTGMLHCCLRVSATKATADIICFFSTTALQQESGILPVLYFPPPCSFPFLCLGRWGWDQSLE